MLTVFPVEKSETLVVITVTLSSRGYYQQLSGIYLVLLHFALNNITFYFRLRSSTSRRRVIVTCFYMLNPTLHFKHLSTFHSIVVLFLLLTVRGSLSDGSEFPLNLKNK